MQRVFEALASSVRRKILAYLAHTELSAGEIASRFNMSKPSISQHLSVLEAAGLVESEKRGQFVYYRKIEENLVNTLNGFVQEVCPFSRPLKRESAELAVGRKPGAAPAAAPASASASASAARSKPGPARAKPSLG